jgi:hypothetical protein
MEPRFGRCGAASIEFAVIPYRLAEDFISLWRYAPIRRKIYGN